MNFVNCTPHDIVMNDGTIYEKTGIVARVAASYTDAVEGICRQTFGKVEDLPEPAKDTYYIVSALVLGASNRIDLVAPATGHPETVRNDKGHIVSVPCFIAR